MQTGRRGRRGGSRFCLAERDVKSGGGGSRSTRGRGSGSDGAVRRPRRGESSTGTFHQRDHGNDHAQPRSRQCGVRGPKGAVCLLHPTGMRAIRERAFPAGRTGVRVCFGVARVRSVGGGVMGPGGTSFDSRSIPFILPRNEVGGEDCRGGGRREAAGRRRRRGYSPRWCRGWWRGAAPAPSSPNARGKRIRGAPRSGGGGRHWMTSTTTRRRGNSRGGVSCSRDRIPTPASAHVAS